MEASGRPARPKRDGAGRIRPRRLPSPPSHVSSYRPSYHSGYSRGGPATLPRIDARSEGGRHREPRRGGGRTKRGPRGGEEVSKGWKPERSGRKADGERGGRTGGGRTADPQAVDGIAARAAGTGARIVSAELQREKRRTSAVSRTCLTRINMSESSSRPIEASDGRRSTRRTADSEPLRTIYERFTAGRGARGTPRGPRRRARGPPSPSRHRGRRRPKRAWSPKGRTPRFGRRACRRRTGRCR